MDSTVDCRKQWSEEGYRCTAHKVIKSLLKDTPVPEGVELNYPVFALPEGLMCEAMLLLGRDQFAWHRELIAEQDEMKQLTLEEIAPLIQKRCESVADWYKKKLKEIQDGPT